MSTRVINSDVICDLSGQPLDRDSATLLKALDKLLTVGAYYSAEHEQYMQSARKARDIIVGILGSPRGRVAIEITAQGLMIRGQNIDPHHRNVRQLHDLLVPLNIARLEIDGSLSPEDLRQAIAALQEHKANLSHIAGFQEVVIEGLPPSVQAISCSVLRQSDEDKGDPRGLDEILGRWDEAQPAGPSGEAARLSQKFLDLVAEILANLEHHVGTSAPLPDGATENYVSVDDLVTLKHTLEHLIEMDPDPAHLAQLITQAEKALGLSRDAKSVDLVFQILKKEMGSEPKKEPTRRKTKSAPPKYAFTVDELLGRVSELAADTTPMPDPQISSQGNLLGIVLQLLRTDPPRALRAVLLTNLEQTVAQIDFLPNHLAIYAQAAATVADDDELPVVDELLPVFSRILRQKQPDLVAPFWDQVIAAVSPDKLAAYWPCLVNDLVLGLNRAPRDLIIRLALAAGRLPVAAARAEGHRLEKQPGLQGGSGARDVFLAPLPEIQAVLAVLLASPLKKWAGEELFHALRKKPLSRLVDLLISALGEHDERQHDFYLELIRHGQDPEPPDSLRGPAVVILKSCLENLTSDERDQEWVPAAILELAGMAFEDAQPLLKHIQTEKRFFFFKAWPAAARKAAAKALAEAGQPTAREGQ